MPPSSLSRTIPSTLVDAVRALEGDTGRGFVFVGADGSERFCSFREMATEAARRAGALASAGLRRGDRIVLVVADGAEFVLSLLGVAFAGAVPVPVHPPSTALNPAGYPGIVAHVTRASGASMLLTTAILRASVEGVEARVVTVEGLAGAGRPLQVRASPDDLALVQFTSGSTARPKAVAVTHANLAANAAGFMIDGLRRDSAVDKGVSWLPLYHDMGLIGFVMGPLFTDVPCVLLPTASFARRPRVWLDAIHRHRGTITFAPNFAYALVAKLLRGKDLGGLDLSSLRVCGCGAEPIQASVLREFAATLAPAGFPAGAFLPSYGMAEATLAVTLTSPGRGVETDTIDVRALAEDRAAPPASPLTATEVVACGEPFPGHEIAIVDDAGRRLGERCVGAIVARGPSISRGYYGEPERTALAYGPVDGADPAGGPWLRTGDRGYLAGGRLFVCGRASDLVVVRGRHYSPSDLEWAVSDVPGVRRGSVVAFGVPDGLVVCCEGSAAQRTAIAARVAAIVKGRFDLAVHEVAVVVPASLPRTSSGKLRRRDARDAYLCGALVCAPAASEPRAESQSGILP